MSKDFFKYGVVMERINKVYHLLVEGKKICPVESRKYVHPQKITIEATHSDGSISKSCDYFPKLEAPSMKNLFTNIRVCSTETSKCEDIEYVYTNPQFNGVFAKLKDNKDVVPFPLGLMDIYWCDWQEYKPKMEVFIHTDVENCSSCGNAHFGMKSIYDSFDKVLYMTCPVTKKDVTIKS